jgi:opacity protein-like surface antigen
MFTVKRSIAIPLLAALTLFALAAPPARAADDDLSASRAGLTFGGRAAYYRPKGADNGSMFGGGQIRLHITPVLALEGSADYRQNEFGGTTVDVYPVQGSLLIYLTPHSMFSPYILGGAGWYHTHVRGPNESTTNRYGPHAGAGLELALAKNWTIDGSWRYLWTQDLTAPTAASPLGKNFSDNGWMVTAALNYRW